MTAVWSSACGYVEGAAQKSLELFVVNHGDREAVELFEVEVALFLGSFKSGWLMKLPRR